MTATADRNGSNLEGDLDSAMPDASAAQPAPPAPAPATFVKLPMNMVAVSNINSTCNIADHDSGTLNFSIEAKALKLDGCACILRRRPESP